MTMPARRLVDIGEVARMLNARIEQLCRELLPDGRRSGAEWEARDPSTGKVGGFNIHLHGQKAGVWKDFVADYGGDALDLVAYVLFGRDKAQAFAWARRWLGLESGDPNAIARARRDTPTAEQREQQSSAEQDDARNAAFRIWIGAEKAVLGTPVDIYLRGRDIPLAELPRAPGAIRFHPALWHAGSARKWPAIVTAVTGGDHRFRACHRTWLEILSDGRVRKAPVEKNKMVLGTYRGAAVRLWRGASNKAWKDMPAGVIVDLTEGIEDGLSVAIAAPECHVLAAISLSNIANVALPDAVRTVRLWRQNDTKPQAIDAFMRAARTHMAAGRQVLVPPIPREVKDVNDLLRAG